MTLKFSLGEGVACKTIFMAFLEKLNPPIITDKKLSQWDSGRKVQLCDYGTTKKQGGTKINRVI